MPACVINPVPCRRKPAPRLAAIAVAAALCLAAAAAPVGAAQPQSGKFTGELEVVLWDGVFHGERPDEGAANLIVDLSATDGRWDRAWGTALGYSNGLHYGLVQEASVTGDAIRLQIGILVSGDQWRKETGHGTYTIELKRTPRGDFEGRYTGVFNSQEIAGAASGAIKPPQPPPPPGFRPVEPDEHPRVLFRRSDLPQLRQRLDTPLGQAYLAQVNAMLEAWNLQRGRRGRGDPINMGVAFALTGQQRFADAALEMIELYLRGNDEFVTEHGGGSGSCGHSIVIVALTYDLCYDGWPEAFKKQLRDRVLTELPNLLRFLHCTSHANNHPCSNYYGPGYGGPAVASLAFWGDLGPAPDPPADATAHLRPISPPANFQPGKNVPTVELQPDRVPAKWIYAGPVPMQAGFDVLANLGGYRAALPEDGTAAEYMRFVGGRPESGRVSFQPLPQEAASEDGINVASLAGEHAAVTLLFFTALKVDREQSVGWVRDSRETRAWLAGVELGDKETYRLAPGVYPLLVVHATARPGNPIAPRFAPAEGALMAQRMAEQELRMALYKQDRQAWETSGGVDQSIVQLVGSGWLRMYRHYRMGIGDGGFQAETGGYADIASWYPTVYATLYHNVLGRRASTYPDVSHLAPRRMMQTVFPDNGKPIWQKISTASGFRPDWSGATYPIVPDPWKPALLWAWNKTHDVTDEKATGNILRGSGLPLALAFVNYPLQTKPKPPASVMPLTWEANTFGYYCFRNGWAGQDDFVGQVYAKASPVRGWNHPNAGTFRVMGFGRHWVTGSDDRVGFRVHEPVVLLPLDETNESQCGHVTHYRAEADGSGAVTINLDDVYSASSVRRSLWDANLLRRPGQALPPGITGLRAIAFDYSGKSGAPALLVLVDQINGGRAKLWQWPVPGDSIGRVKVDTNTFTIDQGDASMKATFITPRDVTLKAGSERVAVGKLGDRHRSFEGVLHRVQATGGDEFFVVVTFSRGAHPEIKTTGAGLDATVTVGAQSIRFDGEKILLGK
jgi:hypothetical protein